METKDLLEMGKLLERYTKAVEHFEELVDTVLEIKLRFFNLTGHDLIQLEEVGYFTEMNSLMERVVEATEKLGEVE